MGGKFRLDAIVFEVPVMLSESYPEGAARLSYIPHVIVGVYESVDPAIV